MVARRKAGLKSHSGLELGAKTEYGSRWLPGSSVKNLPVIQGTRVRSLGWDDPLEKEMAAHSSILAWKIQWTEEPGELQSTGSQTVGHNLATKQHRGCMFYPLWELALLSRSHSEAKTQGQTIQTSVFLLCTIHKILLSSDICPMSLHKC